eukprot:m.88026 g.88026  ORF g.88026 m.88026 type:complete len:412 (-) comp14803_c0_seq2:510-1745(-)
MLRQASRAASSVRSSQSLHHTRSRVLVAGAAKLPVTRQQDTTLSKLGGDAITAALDDAGVDPLAVKGLFVGNMMSGMLSSQQHLGPLLANAAGLDNAEAATAEACCGAGGAALRWGYMALMSGEVDVAVVAGVEMMTHCHRDVVTKGLATASHWPTEGNCGETFVSLNGHLMTEYMRRYNRPHADFAPFAITAHDNAATASHAVFNKKQLDLDTFEQAQTITGPVQLFDASPTCDGAAAVVLVRADSGIAPSSNSRPQVELVSSAAAVDQLAVNKRPDLLELKAVKRSALQAMEKAGVTHDNIDIFELHDAYTIMAALSLENAGFVEPGAALDFAATGGIALSGRVPMATFGGLKARGHPVGATGVYQAAEMYAQLTTTAGANQVSNAKVCMTQNIGGSGASVYAHVFATV